MATRIAVDKEATLVLQRLCKRKRVSQQGLISALLLMLGGQRPELGIVEIDWPAIQQAYPTNKIRNQRNWDLVVLSVKTLMKDFETAEEIAHASRWTLPQVERAMTEIKEGRA